MKAGGIGCCRCIDESGDDDDDDDVEEEEEEEEDLGEESMRVLATRPPSESLENLVIAYGRRAPKVLSKYHKSTISENYQKLDKNTIKVL